MWGALVILLALYMGNMACLFKPYYASEVTIETSRVYKAASVCISAPYQTLLVHSLSGLKSKAFLLEFLLLGYLIWLNYKPTLFIYCL